MNFARRLFSSTARASSQLVAASSPAPIHPDALPPVLQRIILRHLDAQPHQAGTSIQLANPFLSSQSDDLTFPPSIPKRRQKQLLETYPSHVLPASPLNPITNPAPVELLDGTLVSWVGEYELREPTSVYGKRKRMFKGHKAERERPAREADRAERMAGMEKRILEWKKTQAEVKAKARSSVPF